MNNIETISNDNFFTVVVDPNGINKENARVEDLFIYVDFRALPKTRSVVQTDGSVTNEVFETKGISFIASKEQNGNRYLTTDYTNIGGKNPKEEEAFGIEYIDIEYGKEFNPIIKVKFVDVRGAGLLNGYETVDSDGILSNNSTFASFFSLPYPLFKLTVKGYYGKAVSYCLNLMKWSMELDAERGNFVINAEFQGYTFAFFNDILMRHVISVINTDVGQEALKAENVISLSELVTRLGKLTSIAEEYKKNSKSFEELKFINSLLLDRIDILVNSIGEVMTVANISSFGKPLPVPQLKNGIDQLFVRDVGLFSEEKLETLKIIIEDLGKYVKDYNEFISSNSSKFPYGNQYKIDDFNISLPSTSYVIDDSSTSIVIDLAKKDGLSDNNALTTASALRSRLSLPDNSTKKFYIIDFHKFRKEVSEIKSELIKKKNEVEKIVNDELNKDIESQLNLKLNISSVFEILLGNVEAYLKVIHDYAIAADNPNIQAERIRAIGGGNVATDISVTYENRVFPFPSTFDVNTGEEVWIGDIVGDDNPYFPEIELVRKHLNAVVTSEGNYTKTKTTSDSGNSVSIPGDSWVPFYLNDSNKPYSQINFFSFNGNEIPQDFIGEIKKRLYKAYQNTNYTDNSLLNLAKTDSSYAFYQTIEPVIKNLINNTSNEDFVNDIVNYIFSISDTGDIFSSPSVYIGTSNDTTGTNLNGLSLDKTFSEDSVEIASIKNQSKRNLSKEVITEIESQKKPLEDILIPNKYKTVHRQIDKNTYLVKGDLTDILWTDEVKANIRKFYKSETSNDLLQEKPVPFTISSKINDFSIFDGQINNSIDFAKPKDVNSKYTNIARKTIGFGLITGVDNTDLILYQDYYNLASPAEQAYLFLLTTPINNIQDFYKSLELGGMYRLTKMQMAWVAGQFWRAKYISDNGSDIFDNIINQLNSNSSIKINTLSNIKQNTLKYLPNLSEFESGFIEKLVKFYENWTLNSYKVSNNLIISDYNPQDKSVENILFNFFDFYKLNSNFPNSKYFDPFKYYYDLLLKEFTEPIDFFVSNLYSIKKGQVVITENIVRSYATQWITTYKKLASENNKNTVVVKDNNSQVEPFYIVDKDIKLAAYKYFKNLYDKWIGGTKDGRVFNSCSGGLSSEPNSKLIDRFHFVDSAFNPIGHIAVVDPETLRTLTSLTDQSLLNFLAKLGSASGFINYILPSFVNYKSPKEGLEMWKPQTTLENVNSGAAYFCVYAQHKDGKILDIGKKSFYANEGFDFRETDINNIPNGFKKRVPLNVDQIPKDKDKYNLVVFRVGYADQNQGIFKTIKLNQTEHKSSMEYIKTMVDTFDPKGGTKPMYKKANLYNIFALRSYQCDVTCLGNLNVHPLNYFQLDNMPFYHGAYQIIKVSHKITANSAETNFSGWRMPRFIHPVLTTVTSFVKIPLSDSLFNESERRKPVFRPLVSNYSEAEISSRNSTNLTGTKLYPLSDNRISLTPITVPAFSGSLVNVAGLSVQNATPANLIEFATSLDRSGLWAKTAESGFITISDIEMQAILSKARQSNSPSAQIILQNQILDKSKLGSLDSYIKSYNQNAIITGKSRIARTLTTKEGLDRVFGFIDPKLLDSKRGDTLSTARTEFMVNNIRSYNIPYTLKVASGNGQFAGQRTSLQLHKFVGESLVYALKEVLDFYGADNIQKLGLNIFAGDFVFRLQTGSLTTPSTHAYGIAIDFGYGAAHNAYEWGKKDSLFSLPVYRPFLDIMEKWGWYNNGRYMGVDWMHFQAASYNKNPLNY